MKELSVHVNDHSPCLFTNLRIWLIILTCMKVKKKFFFFSRPMGYPFQSTPLISVKKKKRDFSGKRSLYMYLYMLRTHLNDKFISMSLFLGEWIASSSFLTVDSGEKKPPHKSSNWFTVRWTLLSHNFRDLGWILSGVGFHSRVLNLHDQISLAVQKQTVLMQTNSFT